MTLMFSDAQLASLVTQTIPAQLPNGHRNALVGSVDSSGAQVVIAMQKDVGTGTWQFQAAVKHEWSGNNEVGAKVIMSW